MDASCPDSKANIVGDRCGAIPRFLLPGQTGDTQMDDSTKRPTTVARSTPLPDPSRWTVHDDEDYTRHKLRTSEEGVAKYDERKESIDFDSRWWSPSHVPEDNFGTTSIFSEVHPDINNHPRREYTTGTYPEDDSFPGAPPVFLKRTLDTDNSPRRVFPGILSRAGAWSAAALMWLYDRSTETSIPGPRTPGDRPDRTLPPAKDLNVHVVMTEVFFLSMLIYGAGTAAIYQANQRRDRYQDAALAVGITIAFGAASVLGEDGRSIFLRILPSSVLVILAVSALAHQLARRYGPSETRTPTGGTNLAGKGLLSPHL